MSVLTGRYSGSPESTFDYDIRQMHEQGFDEYGTATFAGELSDAYWDALLPQEMNTSSSSSPYFRVFQAAQVKLHDKGFLSKDISVHDLILNKCDVHHFFPKKYLKGLGLSRGRYNQIANYVIAQSEINIAIGDKPPATYFRELAEQCQGGKRRYGGIIDLDELRSNLRMNCIPEGVLKGDVDDYLILLPDGKQYISASTAALMLKVNRSTIHYFIESGELSAKMLPRTTTRIIPLDEFLEFAKKPRVPGRPPKQQSEKKKTAKKVAKKTRKG